MKLSIDEIETKGLRCPDALISFQNNKTGGVINLLQMPNGTGKTTIINLIEGTLTGQIRDWKPSDVIQYKSKGEAVNKGEFRIALTLEAEEIKKITFKSRFDFEHGQINVFTIRSEESGEEFDWLPPPGLRQFISPGCVKVFCFKGDQIKNIINKDKSDAETTLKAFFGFDDIEDFIQKIRDYHRSAVQTGRPVNNANVTELEKLILTWEERAEALKDRLEEEEEKERKINLKIEDLEKNQSNIIALQEKGLEEQERLNKQITDAVANVDSASSSVWEDLKNPFLISDQLLTDIFNFRKGLEKMKLPGGSRSFFEELIEKNEDCICGDPLTPEKIQNIRNEIDSYLGDDTANIINIIKEEISDAFDNRAEIDLINSKFTALNDAIQTKNISDKELEDFMERMREATTEENQKIFDDYKEAIGDSKDIERRLKSLRKDYVIEKHQLQEPENCYSQVAAENAIDTLTKELGRLSDRLEISASYEILKKVINRAKHSALKEIKEHLRILTNEKIRETLPEGAPIEVLELDKYLKLGWQGAIQQEGSGAQNIIIAYSFARSVLEEASIEFPLIVDHPVANVDIKNRKVLGEKMPSMMHQFIGFLIDSERDGFLEGLSDIGDVNYISLFSDIKGNQPFIETIEQLPNDEYKKTKNGYLTYNKEFFIRNVMGDH